MKSKINHAIEAETGSEDANSERIRKMELILSKAMEYADKLIHHRSQAKKDHDSQSQSKIQSKRKHNYACKEALAKEERAILRKSTGTENEATYLTVQPSLLRFGVLKNYQMNGLNWMIQLYELGMNGILADDMGLGKTIQTIAQIAFLKQYKHITGKFLIIAPLVTLNNWKKEFTRWLPCCKAVILYAREEERQQTISQEIVTGKFDVIITSYEGVKKSQTQLQKINWEYMIVDEAHKLKNESSQLSLLLKQFKTKNRLLLTGTPLQNSIKELITLLNFVMPQLFNDTEIFDGLIQKTAEKNQKSNSKQAKHDDEEKEEQDQDSDGEQADEDTDVEEKIKIVSKLHQIIKPFMLRRTKEDSLKDLPPKREIHLFVGLSELQLKMYKNILLNKSIDTVYRGERMKNYNNMLMQLRKVCAHPYLFDGVEDRDLPEYGDHLVLNCGKMVVLDKLLQKLASEKKSHHQVLVFSQFTGVLDILEDYIQGNKWDYCRIDGDTDVQVRENMMNEFQEENSKKFIFLLSTRAGGLGINLTNANFVVIYDSDFNPQIDLQAMDRAYRIGQTREVKVIRLITEYTVEAKIIERQTIKLKLDQIIVQTARAGVQTNFQLDQHSTRTITQFGADQIFKAKGSTISDEDIELLLKKGEKQRDEQNKEIDEMLKEKAKGLFDIEIKQINCKEFFGEDMRMEDEIALKQAALQNELDNKKRVYEEQYKKSRTIKVKEIRIPEHHLYLNRQRLEEIMQKEEEYLAKGGLLLKMGLYSEDYIEKMAENNGLTDEEVKEKEELISKGFPYWDSTDYKQFLAATYKHGKDNIKAIAKAVDKPFEEVKNYHETFWKNGPYIISNFKYIQNKAEEQERMAAVAQDFAELAKLKMEDSNGKRESIQFNPKIYKKYSSNNINNLLERDRILLMAAMKHGYWKLDYVMFEIQNSPLCSLDETFRMMRTIDLRVRFRQLLTILKAEKEQGFLGIKQKEAEAAALKKQLEEAERLKEIEAEKQRALGKAQKAKDKRATRNSNEKKEQNNEPEVLKNLLLEDANDKKQNKKKISDTTKEQKMANNQLALKKSDDSIPEKNKRAKSNNKKKEEDVKNDKGNKIKMPSDVKDLKPTETKIKKDNSGTKKQQEVVIKENVIENKAPGNQRKGQDKQRNSIDKYLKKA